MKKQYKKGQKTWQFGQWICKCLICAVMTAAEQADEPWNHTNRFSFYFCYLTAGFISCDNYTRPHQAVDLSQWEWRCPHWHSALHSCIVRARLCKNIPNIIKLLSVWARNNYRINLKRYKIPWRTSVLDSRSARLLMSHDSPVLAWAVHVLKR